jgi:hypothetical protein
MKTEIGCAVLLCLMGTMAGAAANGNMAGSIESDPIDSVNDVTTTRTLGVCYPAPSEQYNGDNTLSPIASANNYFYDYEHQTYEQQNIAAKVKANSASVTILQQPKHGVLRLVTEADRGTLFDNSATFDPTAAEYAYLPEKGYGNDSATLLVDFGGGLKVKVVYIFQQHEGPLGNTGWEDVCTKTGTQWKISSTLDANGNSTISSVEYQSPTIAAGATSTDTAALASTLESSKKSMGSDSIDLSASKLIADSDIHETWAEEEGALCLNRRC